VAHTVVFLAALFGAAVQPVLDLAAVDEALRIGSSRDERLRARFHEPYRVAINRPPVDYIDIVTPFRRVEIEAEQRTRSGNRSLSQRDALILLDTVADAVDVFVEFTFHPLHTYVGVPAYDVALAPATPAGAKEIRPRQDDRIPRFGARFEGMRLPYPIVSRFPNGETMTGGTVLAKFDLRAIDANGAYDVVVREAGKELARARIDFRALR
jgi:hypothetical protein